MVVVQLAVAGGKGGCGKTTTALALAGALVETRRTPIVVDCDRDMPNLHVYAGTRDEPGVDDLAAGMPVADVAHDARRPDGVRIIPSVAGSDVAGALDTLPKPKSALNGEFGTGLEQIHVFDTPAGASTDVAVPLREADATVLVTTVSGQCVRAAVKTASMARALEAPVTGVVVSRAERVPPALPGVFGVPRERVVSVPTTEHPVSVAARGPVRRLCGLIRPNA